MSTQVLSVSLPSEIIYVSGTVNGVSQTWTLVEGSWQTVAERAADDVYRVSLTAVNALGTSASYEFTLYYGVLHLITDRTQADVDALNALLAKPMSQWTAAEKAALLGGMKGAYNASDLNRVGAAVSYLAGKLHALGYAVSVSVKQDWANSDSPTDGDMEVYRDNVAALRAVLAVFADTPATPEDLVRLTWREANDIEKILVDVDQLIQNLQRSWYYSGEVCAGEV